MRRKAFALGFFALVAAVVPGCSSSTDPPADQMPSGVVEIGPEGGELVDNGSGGFPGFALKIPAGALAVKTKVSFGGVADETPLPPGAERIGAQVKLLPEGTTLAKPALLTVPVDHALRSAYENPASECKVWAREGAGWKRLEAVSTTDDSVTVEVSSFHSAAAAGVIIKANSVSCTGTACKTIKEIPVLEPVCNDPSGFCISRIPSPPSPQGIFAYGQDAMTLAGNKLYYVRVDLAGPTFIPHAYDLESQTVTRYPGLVGEPGQSASAVTFSRMAVASNEDVWAAVGGFGNVRFPKAGLVQILDAPGTEFGGLTRPESVTVANINGSDLVVRYVSSMNFATAIRSFFAKNGNRASQLFLGSFSEQLAGQAISTGAVFLRSNRQGFCGASALAPNEAVSCNMRTVFLELPSYGAFALSTQAGAATVPASSGTNATYRPLGGASEVSFTFPAPVSDMVFGDDGLLYAINTSRPQIMIWDKATPPAVTVLPLTTLAAGTEGANERLPKRIFKVAGKDELIVITQGTLAEGQAIYRIRRSR